jgi:hypothetical protein
VPLTNRDSVPLTFPSPSRLRIPTELTRDSDPSPERE